MSVNIGVVDETTYKQLARRIHKVLRKTDPNYALPLGHIQEAVIQALGFPSLYEAQQQWQKQSGQTAISNVNLSSSPWLAFSPSPGRPAWPHLPAPLREDIQTHSPGFPTGKATQKKRRRRQRSADSRDATQILWESAKEALVSGSGPFLAWAETHAHLLSSLEGLDDHGEKVSLCQLLLDSREHFFIYTLMMERARRQGWALFPLISHLTYYLRQHLQHWQWLKQDDWLWFADQLHEAQLEGACRAVWFFKGHQDYNRPGEQARYYCSPHMPWLFLERAVHRNDQAVNLAGWLPIRWRIHRQDWSGAVAWLRQKDPSPALWRDDEQYTFSELFRKAVEADQTDILDVLLTFPLDHIKDNSRHGASLLAAMPEMITTAHTHKNLRTAQQLMMFYGKQLATDHFPIDVFSPLFREQDHNTFEFWLAELSLRGHHPTPQDRVALLINILNDHHSHFEWNPQTRNNYMKMVTALRKYSQNEQTWRQTVQLTFVAICEQENLYLSPDRHNDYVGILHFLLSEGASWTETQAGRGVALHLFLEGHCFSTKMAQVAFSLGADFSSCRFEERTIAEELLERHNLNDPLFWYALGVPRLTPQKEHYLYLQRLLDDEGWLTHDLETQVAQYTQDVLDRQIPKETLRQVWDWVRHPRQITWLAELAGDCPTSDDLAIWLTRPTLSQDIEARREQQEDRFPDLNIFEKDDHDLLTNILTLFKEAQKCGTDLTLPFGENQDTLLHWVVHYPDKKGRSMVTLVDFLVHAGLNPWTPNAFGHRPDEQQWTTQQAAWYNASPGIHPQAEERLAHYRQVLLPPSPKRLCGN